FDVDVLVFQRADEMFEGRVPKERVDRLQREPPDLRAGILQRLGENLGHLFAWTTQKPVHDILGEEDFPVGGVRPRRLDDLALFEPCQRVTTASCIRGSSRNRWASGAATRWSPMRPRTEMAVSRTYWFS